MLSKYFFTALKKITAHAQNFSSTLYVFDNKRNEDGQSELKILVSVVRFRPGPPKSSAQLFSVGRFRFGDPQTVRGPAQLYVCHTPPASEAVMPPKSHTPLSLLRKLLRTLTMWHTQNAFHGNSLCVCRIEGFAMSLAGADHKNLIAGLASPHAILIIFNRFE